MSMKAGITAPAPDRWSPQITIGMPVLIPEDYVTDLPVRLALYRRLAEIEDDRAIEAFAAELVDRFGPLPDEVEYLLQVVAIKSLCRRANVERIEVGPKGAVLAFRDNVFNNPDGLIAYIAKHPAGARVRPDMKVVFFDGMGLPARAPQRRDGDFALAGGDRGAREGGVTFLSAPTQRVRVQVILIVTTGLDPVVHAASPDVFRRRMDCPAFGRRRVIT